MFLKADIYLGVVGEQIVLGVTDMPQSLCKGGWMWRPLDFAGANTGVGQRMWNAASVLNRPFLIAKPVSDANQFPKVLPALLLGKPNPPSLFHRIPAFTLLSEESGGWLASATEVSRAEFDYLEDTRRARSHCFCCQGEDRLGEHC